jgi:hypothetical protein
VRVLPLEKHFQVEESFRSIRLALLVVVFDNIYITKNNGIPVGYSYKEPLVSL